MKISVTVSCDHNQRMNRLLSAYAYFYHASLHSLKKEKGKPRIQTTKEF